jgi:Fe-S oxidoreductase
MSGYRGFLRELQRTGTPRALALQVRTGIIHVARQAAVLLRLRPPAASSVGLFFDNYSPDGIRPADAERAELRFAAEACLTCGLCSAECARTGRRPALDPRDAVIAASRLETDLLRHAIELPSAEACSDCGACEPFCPSRIPIRRVQLGLASLR